MLDFPSDNLQVGQLFPDPLIEGVPLWMWDGEKWITAAGEAGIPEPPDDGEVYGREVQPGQEEGMWERAASPQFVDDGLNTKVNRAGDTMTGTLNLSGGFPNIQTSGDVRCGGLLTVWNNATTAQFALMGGPSPYQNVIQGYSNYSMRWQMMLGDGSAETGGNAGNNFSIQRMDDDGLAIGGSPLTINRATGNVTLAPDATTNVHNLHAASNITATGNISTTSGNVSGANVSATTNITSSGTLNVSGTGTAGAFHSYGALNNGSTCSFVGGNVTVEAHGIRYNAWGAGNNAHAFLWNWPHWGGTVNIAVDGGGAWIGVTPVCDERVKQDIAPSQLDCLAVVETLPIFQFRWMDQSVPGDPQPVEPTEDNLVPIGLVAQRTYEVAPYLVHRPHDEVTRTADGRPSLVLWNIEPNNVLALLIGAVQQIAARIRVLEAS